MVTQSWTANKISKIKLIDKTYLIKDASARAKTDTYELNNGAGTKSFANEVTDSTITIATATAIKSYISTSLSGIKPLTYIFAWNGASEPKPAEIPAGVKVTYNSTEYTGTLAASAATSERFYLVATSQGASTYKQYIAVNDGGYKWELVGETTAGNYVTNLTWVTGSGSEKDHLLATRGNGSTITMEFGKIASAASLTGSTSVENVITGVTLNPITVSGDATITTAATAASVEYKDYTPEGTASGAFTADGSVSVTIGTTTTNMNVPSTTLTPAGTISTPKGTDTIADPVATETTTYKSAGNVTLTLTNNTFNVLTGLGTAASVSGTDKVEGPTFSSTGASANSVGYTATVTSEVLTFGAAPTVSAITSATFSSTTFTAGTFTPNVLPTNAAAHALAFTTSFTGTKATDLIISAPKFTDFNLGTVEFSGTEVEVVTGAKYLKSQASATSPSFTGSNVAVSGLSFSGTKASNAGVDSVSYDDAQTTNFSATFTPEFDALNTTKATQTVSVVVAP